MKKFILAVLITAFSVIGASATALGDIVVKIKNVPGAFVAEMRPEFAPNGLPIESGYIMSLPQGAEAPIIEALNALGSQYLYYSAEGEQVYVDSKSDPCEILLVASKSGDTTAFLYMLGSEDMIDLLKSK